ncbi:AMIN domain-containing protein, partial [bacterium]|nr:AMIN domain-containing protein [bacterium]
QAYRQASIEFGKILALKSEHKKAEEYLSECQVMVEAKVTKEIPEEGKIILPEIKPIEEGPPEKIATLPTPRSPTLQSYGDGALRQAGAEAEKEKESREIKEELEIIPTPLPEGAKVIHSTDVVSEVKTEILGEKMRVVITLSGERKYMVSEKARPPSIIIDIPHTINAVSPGRIVVNQRCVRMIEVIQYRSAPFDEARIKVILNRWIEYRVTHKDNEIYIDFEE